MCYYILLQQKVLKNRQIQNQLYVIRHENLVKLGFRRFEKDKYVLKALCCWKNCVNGRKGLCLKRVASLERLRSANKEAFKAT